MNQEVLFAKTLEELRDMASLQGNFVTREQIEEAFAAFALDENRFALIEEYLKERKIGIGEPVNPDDYLSTEEKNYLDIYLEELALLQVLSEGEKRAVCMSAIAGDNDAQNKLIEIFLPQVVDIAKLYAGQGVFLEDLIGEGNMALTMGVKMLGCLEKAEEVDGMLGSMIMEAMEDLIQENATAGKEEKKLSEKVNQVADAARELAQELQREVTVEELAAETGLSKKAIMKAVKLTGNTIEYLKAEEMKELADAGK